MRAVILGGGSIGKRHLQNLQALGIESRVIDIDEIDSIDSILKDGFDIGLVCTPNIFHIEHCIKLAENNIHIFCEKPFYTNKIGVEKLLNIVEKNQLITMVGCNLRFTPEIQQIDPTSKYINVYFGYNLKKWRPNSDHLKSYSANQLLGGGILLDAIHELDYLYFKFHEIENISYIKDKISDITNNTEDLVRGRISFKNGTIADFTLNYLSTEYQRYYDILNVDTLDRVSLNLTNQMYIDEIRYFIDHVVNNNPCMNDFKDAHNLLSYLV